MQATSPGLRRQILVHGNGSRPLLVGSRNDTLCPSYRASVYAWRTGRSSSPVGESHPDYSSRHGETQSPSSGQRKSSLPYLSPERSTLTVTMRLSIFCAKVAPPSLSCAENRHFGAAEVKFRDYPMVNSVPFVSSVRHTWITKKPRSRV